MSGGNIAWIVVGSLFVLFLLFLAVAFFPEAVRTIKIHRM